MKGCLRREHGALLILTAALLTAVRSLPSAVAGPPAQGAATERAEELLARAREALGWKHFPAGGGLRVRGRARLLGAELEQVIVFDARGRFVQTFEGELDQSGGCDGQTSWSVDWGGTGRALVLGDRAFADLTAGFLQGTWCLPGAPLELLFEEPASADSLVTAEPGWQAGSGVADEVLEVEYAHADGVLRGRLRLDPQSYLLRSATLSSGPTETEVVFGEFRAHDGFYFPTQVELLTGSSVQALETGDVERLEELSDELFTPRLERTPDTRFDAEQPAALEVVRARTGHLLVHPLVDGRDLGWFIFDSGAGINCIAEHALDEGFTGPVGQITAGGIGGAVEADLWRAKQLALGPMTLEDPIFMSLDLSLLEEPFGVEIGGIIGFELLARCVTEFDMSAGTIALFEPRGYELGPRGHWEPALLYGKRPHVRASLIGPGGPGAPGPGELGPGELGPGELGPGELGPGELGPGGTGHEGVFLIDTGAAGGNLTLHYQLVADLGLADPGATSPGRASGVGGTVATRLGTIEGLIFGGRRFDQLPTEFAVEDKGVLSDDYVWGDVGGRLLESFVLVLDYPHGRIGFIAKD